MPMSTLKMSRTSTINSRKQSTQMKRQHRKSVRRCPSIISNWNWHRKRLKRLALKPKTAKLKKRSTARNPGAVTMNCSGIPRRKAFGSRQCGLQFGQYTSYSLWLYPIANKIASKNCFRWHSSCASYGLARYHIWWPGWSPSLVWHSLVSHIYTSN